MVATQDALKIELHVTADRAIVRLLGEAHMFTVWELERELNRVASVQPRQVILDLEDLTFISSLAVGALVKFRHALVRTGGTASIVGASGPVADALARLGLDKLFRVEA